MRLRLPVDAIDTDQPVRLTLDDGRIVSIHGNGNICVYRPETHGLGTEDYNLMLPDVYDVQRRCDRPNAATGNGHVLIEVEHRH